MNCGIKNEKYMEKVIEFYVADSKLNDGEKILIAKTETNEYVVSGDHHFPTYLKEVSKSSDAKSS